MDRQIVLIAHNLRSAHNVGSLLRTADGLGVHELFLTGYTPYPWRPGDVRLPHLAHKTDHRIAKTALGAQEMPFWKYEADLIPLLDRLKKDHFTIAALEQTPTSLPLPGFKGPGKLALIVGREVEGLELEIIQACDLALEIPMDGQKESFNVAIAAAIALYHLRHGNQ